MSNGTNPSHRPAGAGTAGSVIDEIFSLVLPSAVADSAKIKATEDKLFVNGREFSEKLPHVLVVGSTGESGVLRFERRLGGMTLHFDSKSTGHVAKPIEIGETRLAVFHDGRFNVAPERLLITLTVNGRAVIEEGNGRHEVSPRDRSFVGTGNLEIQRSDGEWVLRYRHPADESEGEDALQTLRIERPGRYEFSTNNGRIQTKSFGVIEYSLDGVLIDGRPTGLSQPVPFHSHDEGKLQLDMRSNRIFAGYSEGDRRSEVIEIGKANRNFCAIVSYHSEAGLKLERLTRRSSAMRRSASREERALQRWCSAKLI